MAKKKEPQQHFLELYDPDPKIKVAYLFPSEWPDDRKQQFRALSSKDKRRIVQPGSGFVHWNDEEFRVAYIPSDALRNKN